MIPAAILSGTWIGTGKNQGFEFRILELSLEYFTFRSVKERDLLADSDPAMVELVRYSFPENRYQKERFEIERLEKVSEQRFYTEYRLRPSGERYGAFAGQLMKEYSDYIHMKLSMDDSSVSERLTGYPAGKEKVFADRFSDQIEHSGFRLYDARNAGISMGILMETQHQYQTYLSLPFEQYVNNYLKKCSVDAGNVKPSEIGFLYIGSQVCPNLFPDHETLTRLLLKARKEEKTVVLQFSYMEESRTERWQERIRLLENWMREQKYPGIEIVLNDWGMMSMVKESSQFQKTLGILILKQRKDARAAWKNGWLSQDHICSAGWTADAFCRYVKEHYGISRFSAEFLPYPERLPGEAVTLYAPFYQMNTSSQCPTAALCRYGNRARQEAITECIRYCERTEVLYPEMLHMVGKYNSIWGYQEQEETEKRLEQMLRQNVDRLVWDYMEKME